jgi:adenosine deaminase
MAVSLHECQQLPKVALHDHLDGGLRASTVLAEAAKVGHQLPADNAEDLALWFYEAADSGSLVRYLETFEHTVAVLQTADSLRRVAREFVLDQAADGVIHAEARWAPEQHLRRGLTLRQAVEAVRDGLAEGVALAAASGHRISVGQILTAMRHVPQPTTAIAELAVAYRHDSVCGFDIAGAEAGFPPQRFAESFALLREHNFEFTIHAGEAAGLDSIAGAVHLGASRIGHGVRLVDDIGEDGAMGELAQFVANRRLALEICPSSNLQTGICERIADHPFALLAASGQRVTINCDNRLMSRTTLSREYQLLSEAFGYGVEQLRRFSVNAAKAAFLPVVRRAELIEWISVGRLV